MSDIKVNSITDLAGTGAPDFPQGLEASGGILGRIDGAAVPAGYVGEKLGLAALSLNTSGAFVWTVHGTPAVTLTPGVWMIHAVISHETAAGTQNSWRYVLNTDNTNVAVGGIATGADSMDNPSDSSGAIINITGYYVASANTPVYLWGFTEDAAGTIEVSNGFSFAVRIA